MTGKLFFALVLIFGSSPVFSQITVLSETNEPLPGSTLYISDLQKGYTADADGKISLPKLPDGRYDVQIRFLGYQPLTANLTITNGSSAAAVFYLKSTDVMYRTVTVYGEQYTFAQRLLLAAIEAKKDRNKDITSLSFDGYHRFKLVKDQPVVTKKGDTIISQFPPQETISQNYWTVEKGIFRTIKQQKLLPLFTFDFQQMYAKNNYYTLDQNEIFVGTQGLKSPLSDDAVSFYAVELTDSSLTTDGMTYTLSIEPENPSDLGFKGTLTIDSKSYHPTRFTATHSKPISGFMLFGYTTDITFGRVEQRAWLPVTFFETFKIFPFMIGGSDSSSKMEYTSSLYSAYQNYSFNQAEDVDLKKISYVNRLTPTTDSLTNHSFTTIPYTARELRGIHALDSMSKKVSVLSVIAAGTSLMMNIRNYPLTQLSDYFRFNRVEGITLGFGYRPKYSIENFQYELAGSYSFANRVPGARIVMDYYFKTMLNSRLNLYLSTGTEARDYQTYSGLTSATFSGLLGHTDPFDYYRSNRASAYWETEPFQFLKFKVGAVMEYAGNEFKSTEFSIFNRSKIFDQNPAISQGQFNRTLLSVIYDNRRYKEIGFARVTVKDKLTLLASADIDISEKDIFKTDHDFTVSRFTIEHEYNFWRNWYYSAKITAVSATSDIPVQFLSKLSTAKSGIGNQGVLLHLDSFDYGGTKQAQGFIELHTAESFIPFSGYFPSWLGTIDLIFMHQFGYAENPNTLKTGWQSTHDLIYGESGIGIGNIFGSFRFDMLWATNPIDNNGGFGAKFGGSLTF